MTEKPPEQGRVASMISALKELLSAPLIFIVAVAILLPLSAGIVANALAFEWENTIALVLVLSGVILLVVIPLMVIYAWRENQKKLSDARQLAIESEAERRNEQERNKQKRLNELFDAKIVNIKAQTDYIFDQSERHERRLLKETSETLAKEMTKGLEFTEKAEKFDLSVTEVIKKLEANDIKFDSVIESLEKISRGLESEVKPGIPKDLPPPMAYDSESERMSKDKDELKPAIPRTPLPPPAGYDSIMSQDGLSLETQLQSKKNEIKKVKAELYETQAHLAEVRDLNEQVQSKYDDLLKEKEEGFVHKFVPTISEDIQMLSSKEKVKSETLAESGFQALEEALKVVDNLRDDAPEEMPRVCCQDGDTCCTEGGPEPDPKDSAPQEHDPQFLAEQKQEEQTDLPGPESKFWTCPKCNRANTLKRPRCMCGKSKPL